jgi:hypothetical protein
VDAGRGSVTGITVACEISRATDNMAWPAGQDNGTCTLVHLHHE